RIGGVEAIQGEDGGGAALPVDRELLGKVSGAVGVGHSTSGQRSQLAEVARIQRKTGNFSAGKPLATAGLCRRLLADGQDADFRLGRQLQSAVERGAARNGEGRRHAPALAAAFHRNVIVSGKDVREGKLAAASCRGLVVAAPCGRGKFDGCRADWFSATVA